MCSDIIFSSRHLFFVQTITDAPLVFLELVTYGDLLGYLRKSRGEEDTYYTSKDFKNPKTVDPQLLFSFAQDVAKGMAFLAENKVSL